MDISNAPVRAPRGSQRPLLILAGLVAGLACGTLAAGTDAAHPLLSASRPIGRLWLDGLTMTVVPLVFALLVGGMAGAARSAGTGVARRAVAWFATLLVAASFASAALTPLALAAWPQPPGAEMLALAGPAAPPAAEATPWYETILPANPVRAAADGAMVPIVVFALLLGLALARVEALPRAALLAALSALGQAMLVIVDWILWLAPIGVFALAIGVGLAAGAGIAGVLAHYVVIVIAACLMATLIAMICAIMAGRISPLAFVRAALPAQIVAGATQSSLAALPAMIATSAPLGVDRGTAGIVLPLSVSLFRMASAAANVTVAVYVAGLHGVDLPVTALLAGAAVAATVSIAAVGLPAQVSFIAVIAPVCLAMGVPITLLPLLMAIETIPDMFRTIGNVTGALAVTRITGRSDP